MTGIATSPKAVPAISMRHVDRRPAIEEHEDDGLSLGHEPRNRSAVAWSASQTLSSARSHAFDQLATVNVTQRTNRGVNEHLGGSRPWQSLQNFVTQSDATPASATHGGRGSEVSRVPHPTNLEAPQESWRFCLPHTARCVCTSAGCESHFSSATGCDRGSRIRATARCCSWQCSNAGRAE